MHGLVNRSIQSFLTDTHGEGFWSALATRIGLPECGFEPMLAYDDRLTDAVLDEASRRLALPREALLEDLGTYLVSHPRMERLRRLLRFGGANFLEFLQSLDDMPGRGRLAVPELDLPALEVRDQGAGRFLLQVRGGPPGSPEILTGVLRAMADDYGALAVIEPSASTSGISRAATGSLAPPPGFQAIPDSARQPPVAGDGSGDSALQDGSAVAEGIPTGPTDRTRPADGYACDACATGSGADAPAQGETGPTHADSLQRAGHGPQAAGASGAARPVSDQTGTDAVGAETPVLSGAESLADRSCGPGTGQGACDARAVAPGAADDSSVPPHAAAGPAIATEDAGALASGASGPPEASGAGSPVAWLQIVLHDPAFATGRRFDLTLAGRG